MGLLSVTENWSYFECILPEIMWKILEYVPESVFELRLVSRAVKYRVDEYAKLRDSIKFVKSLQIHEWMRDTTRIRICIDQPSLNLFELRLKLRLCASVVQNIQRDPCSNHTIPSDGSKAYNLELAGCNDHEKLSSCLRDCLGIRIGELTIHEYENTRTVNILAMLLDGIQVQEMRFFCRKMSEVGANQTLSNIKLYKMELLHISVQSVDNIDPVPFLLALSSCVRSLIITQYRDFYGERARTNDNFLFGTLNLDWAPIILNMFSNKLDTLYILNRWYPRYLSIESADLLRERLPLIGKKIWFEATCSNFYNPRLDYVINDHIVVQGGGHNDIEGYILEGESDRQSHFPTRSQSVLSVKHSSRVNENFSTIDPHY